ncbi:MAG TPA: YcaO-like family protein, partial [Burkholderiales bacterium]|nr:YcaO-like family protein [Burkholderiales bacterium]
KASGVMEALEVWHAERIVAPLKLASFEEMRGEHRVADVARLPRLRRSRYTATLPLLWIEAEDLLAGGSAWVPFELVSTNYTLPLPPGSGCFQANTNGLASGNHRLEAISHGLCEVVERDATTLWRHRKPNTSGRRVLDLDSVNDPACQSVLEKFAAANLRVRVWDTTTDVGIASFVCLVMGRDEDDADPEFGAGCHPARPVALLRALTEAAQARTTYVAGARDDYFPHLYSRAFRARRKTLCNQLLESPEPQRAFEDVPDKQSSAIEDDLRWMLARLRAVGMDQVHVVDLGREGIGVPVARVIVPGLEGAMGEGDADYVPGFRARRCLQERVSQ